MTATELLAQISEAGGKLRLRDGRLYSKSVPEHLVPELERLKLELVRYLGLKAASDPFSPEYVFPSCPGCQGFALHRKNNVGDYECQGCGLKDISEARARRTE